MLVKSDSAFDRLVVQTRAGLLVIERLPRGRPYLANTGSLPLRLGAARGWPTLRTETEPGPSEPAAAPEPEPSDGGIAQEPVPMATPSPAASGAATAPARPAGRAVTGDEDTVMPPAEIITPALVLSFLESRPAGRPGIPARFLPALPPEAKRPVVEAASVTP